MSPHRTSSVRILLVDADVAASRATRDLVEAIDLWHADVAWVGTYEDAARELAAGSFDAALVDYRLGEHTALDLLADPEVARGGTPLILLTDEGLEADLLAAEGGAADYLPRAGLGTAEIERSIRYAMQSRRRHRAEARFRAVVENSRDLVSILRADGAVVYVSSSAQEILGRSAESLLGGNSLDVVHPDDRAMRAAALARVSEGATVRVRYRVAHTDGTWRVLDSILQDFQSQPLIAGIVSHSRDVTQQVQGEQERLFQAELLDAVVQGIIASDPDGTVRYWNRAAEAMYGWTPEEALGRQVVELTVSEAMREQAVEALRSLSPGTSWTGEFEACRKDGSTFHATLTNSPIIDDDGRVSGIIGISSDITERRQLEDRLRQAQKMEAIGQLAGGVAHDFNNLLTAILGRASLLLEDLRGGSPAAEDVAEIHQAAESARDLTRQLLAFSRRQLLEEKVLDLNNALGTMEPLLRRLIPERIRVTFRLRTEPFLVRADGGQLQQVVMNLMVNAADAIAAEGTIAVILDSVEMTQEHARRIPWKFQPGTYARVTVEDSGEGMDEETVQRIFEPFYTTKPEGKGTGLGLSTVYGIVKQSNGHIFVRSSPGQGSAFEVLLPMVQGEAEAPAATPEQHSVTAGHGGTVLLVEDEPLIRKLAQRVLRRAGYTVMEAENGRQALDLIGAGGSGIRLVVSDLVMPEMGGRELLDHLRENDPGVRVLLTSGYSENLELPADVDFLAKPFTPAALLRAVGHALER